MERFEIEKNTGSLEKQWNGYACKVSPISWFLVNNPLVDDYKNRKVVFFQTYVSFLSNMGGFIYCDKCELKEGDIANASLIYNIIYLKDNWYFVQMT
ncbi:MAG: hypothetical protein LBB10_01900 [Bifidobacteriaceae bacterium]|nr:hypothetical protein [Bifidobacteriaceae bacterium]